MGEQALAARQLKNLLDGVLVAHRDDINAFAGGHLNESNLRRHVEQSTRTPWAGALGQIPSNVPRTPLLKKSKPKNDENMKDTLATFSLGTAGGLGLPPVKSRKSKQKSPKLVKDTTFIEELKLPDMMLNETDYPDEGYRGSPIRASRMHHQDDVDEERDAASEDGQETTRDDLELMVRHRFVPAHHEAITKHDQYASMKAFEAEIVRKQDGEEQHVLSGVKAVQHLETRLEEGLDALPYEMNSGPNFHRLQVYSSVFDDLVKSSPTFSFMLNIIKQEYDDFVSSLLDSQAGRHQALHDQVAQLSARGTSNPMVLSQESQRVHNLEAEAKQLLETNERLRKELEEEKRLAARPKPASAIRAPVRRQDPPMDLVDEVESLRTGALERIDKVNKLRQELQQNMVPASVCTHLEQCIKETEIEIQKSLSQKQYFERNIDEMESDMQEALEQADTTPHDAKRVWTKLSAVMGDGSSQSDDDSTEENKWSWYIS